MRHRRQAPFPRRRLRRRGQDEPAADAQRQLHRTRAGPRRAVDAHRPGGERGVRRDVQRVHVRGGGQGDERGVGAQARVRHRGNRGPTVEADVRGRGDPAARPEAQGRRRSVPRVARRDRRRQLCPRRKLVRRRGSRRHRKQRRRARRGDLVRGAARVDPVPRQRRRGIVLRVVPQGGRRHRRVPVARVRSNRRRRGARKRDGSRVAPVDRRAKVPGGARGGGGHASYRSVQAVAEQGVQGGVLRRRVREGSRAGGSRRVVLLGCPFLVRRRRPRGGGGGRGRRRGRARRRSRRGCASRVLLR
mmetsp:Transcript_7801/g.35371  ORF Transcript_7801/g.35371 Transcript_7801/m.35371 type:complete len:303 (+) Transcript_7801:359-1267(+)